MAILHVDWHVIGRTSFFSSQLASTNCDPIWIHNCQNQPLHSCAECCRLGILNMCSILFGLLWRSMHPPCNLSHDHFCRLRDFSGTYTEIPTSLRFPKQSSSLRTSLTFCLPGCRRSMWLTILPLDTLHVFSSASEALLRLRCSRRGTRISK